MFEKLFGAFFVLEIATPDFIRLAMTGVFWLNAETSFSGCLKDLKEKVKQLCLFAVCCLLFAHYYTLNETFVQSYLVENIEKNGFTDKPNPISGCLKQRSAKA